MRDADVRAAVRHMLKERHNGDERTRIVEEMGVWSGSVRIDIAVINGELSGFELKSDRDTLERLPFQAELYSKVFDRVTLVVGSRHADKARIQVPDWWGVMVATQGITCVELAPYREGDTNPSPDPYLVAQLLWKDEALSVLEAHGLARGWRAKRIKLIHQRLAAEIPFGQLGEHVRSALKHRGEWLRQMMSCHLDVAVDADPNPVLQI